HAMRTREGIAAVQMIFNLLEQSPGTELLEVAEATDTQTVVRVPHSSGMLEGNLTEDTVFPPDDHRRHRPRSWLVEGVRKVARLDFLTTDMTLGQAALKWVLAHDRCASTLPNIYGEEQLVEFAAAPDLPDLAPEVMDRVRELYDRNCDVEPIG